MKNCRLFLNLLSSAGTNTVFLMMVCTLPTVAGTLSCPDPILGPVPTGITHLFAFNVQQSPHLGHIELGAYAPEAALNYGIENPCLMTFDDNRIYGKYRLAVRTTYGADLSDMNYLGVGMPDWQGRYIWFRNWLFRAAPYGPPTIALEPIGPTGFSVFQDSPEMRYLRQVFQQANDQGIVVWVRFASESNDGFNSYSICGSPEKIKEYRRSVEWFRSYMPPNIRLVFSPLINDLFNPKSNEVFMLREMYEPGVYDRIGGTLYATSWIDPEQAYNWYYNYMSGLDPHERFQICELGGTFSKEKEICKFLEKLKAGRWPKVDRVNLFAGELNPVAVMHHGHFGLVLPGESISYLRTLIAGSEESQQQLEMTASLPETAERSALGAGSSNLKVAENYPLSLSDENTNTSLTQPLTLGQPGNLPVEQPILTTPAVSPVIASQRYALAFPERSTLSSNINDSAAAVQGSNGRLNSPLQASLMPPTTVPSTSPTPNTQRLKPRQLWQSPIMTVRGRVLAASDKYHTFVVLVDEVIDTVGNSTTISPARKKRVYTEPGVIIDGVNSTFDGSNVSELKGQIAEVTGSDEGTGTSLQATEIAVLPQ